MLQLTIDMAVGLIQKYTRAETIKFLCKYISHRCENKFIEKYMRVSKLIHECGRMTFSFSPVSKTLISKMETMYGQVVDNLHNADFSVSFYIYIYRI